MDVGTELREPVQTRSEVNLKEFGVRGPAQSAEEGQEEDDEFQRPRRVEFLDEQKHPVSREEREEHELLGHVQYRSWCRHCAAARGVGQQHRQLSEDPVDATVPEIVLDYYFMGEESETAPHIVVKDRKSSAYFSTSLDSKTSQYAVAFVAGAIQELGYKRILLKSDNEPAIKRLKERVSECLPGVECVPKEAPVGDSRANGSAENAVKQVKGQFRTLKTSTEDRYRCKIDAKSCLLAWIPRHCANLMTRFKRYSDGRTAIQRLTGRRWGRPMVVFGETFGQSGCFACWSPCWSGIGFRSCSVCGTPWQVWCADGFDRTWSGESPQFQESTRERSFHRLRIGEVEGVTLESTRFLGGATGRWAGCPGNSNSACTYRYATTSTKNPREKDVRDQC